MTRRPFGGGPADVATTVDGSGRLEVARNAWVTVYTASTGGTVADLLAVAGGAPVSAGRVGTDAFGMIGAFSGPDDGSSVLWGDAGSGDRVRMDTTDLPGRVTTLETETSGEALQSALTAEISRATTAEALLVPQTQTVNGHPLTGNVTVTASDVGAAAAAPVQSVAGKTGAVSLVKADVGLGSVDNTSDASKPLSTAATAALAAKADLVGGVVPTSQIPALAISDTFTAASQAAMLALTAQRGDVAIRTDLNPQRAYMLTADDPSVVGNWLLISDPTAAVTSVNGQTGVAVLAKGDVGLGNVDNTADSAKPVSTAQATADAAVLTSAHTYADAAVSTQHTADNGTYAPIVSPTFEVLTLNDTFQRSDGALGNDPNFGYLWNPTGGGPPTIVSNRMVASVHPATSYACVPLARAPIELRGTLSFVTGGGTDASPANLVLASSSVANTASPAWYLIHVQYNQTGWQAQKAINNVFTTLGSGSWNTPIPVDGTTRNVKWRLVGNTLTITGPNGETASVTDADLGWLNGRYCFWSIEPQDANSPKGRWHATTATEQRPANPLYGPSARDLLIPDGGVAQSSDRDISMFSALSVLVSGTMYCSLLTLPGGVPINWVEWWSVGAGSAMTHQWACLLDMAGRVIAVSADQTSTAWGATTAKRFQFTSAEAGFTTTANQFVPPGPMPVWAGLVVVGTVPTLSGHGTSQTSIQNYAPRPCGGGSSGLTTPSTVGTILLPPNVTTSGKPYCVVG